MGQQPVRRGGFDLVGGQLLITRPGPCEVAFGGGDPLQEGQAEPAGQGRGDDAAAGAVGRRHGDQPYGGPGRDGGAVGRGKGRVGRGRGGRDRAVRRLGGHG